MLCMFVMSGGCRMGGGLGRVGRMGVGMGGWRA